MMPRKFFLLQLLHEILDMLFDFVHGPAKPLRPLKEAPKAEPKPKKQRETAKVHVVGGRRFIETEAPDGTIEWENMAAKTSTVAGRSEYVTDFDFEQLAAAGLDDEKAAVIKPFWAEGLTATQIKTALNGDGERYGLGLRTIESYTAAFSRAFSAETESR